MSQVKAESETHRSQSGEQSTSSHQCQATEQQIAGNSDCSHRNMGDDGEGAVVDDSAVPSFVN